MSGDVEQCDNCDEHTSEGQTATIDNGTDNKYCAECIASADGHHHAIVCQECQKLFSWEEDGESKPDWCQPCADPDPTWP